VGRRLKAMLAAVAVAGLVGLVPTPAAAAPRGPSAEVPERMAALGDSITRAFHAECGFLQDCPTESWTTGISSTFDSQFERLVAIDPILTRADNLAVTGADSFDLPAQADAVADGTGFVTLLIGANDACTDTASEMTAVADFTANVGSAFGSLAALDPRPQVLVASIPDLYRLWEVGRVSGGARFAWWLYGICPSMLEDPLSTSTADEQRRQQVRQRVVDYNAALAAACAAYGESCRFDGGAVFGYPFTLDQLSTIDYFHPNVTGQAVLAEVTWEAGFSWMAGGEEPPPDPEPEVVTLGVRLEGEGVVVKRDRWTAMVTATVSDQAGKSVEGASVTGDWGGSARGSGSCTTDASGTCTLAKSLRGESASFTVTDAVAEGAEYTETPPSVTIAAP